MPPCPAPTRRCLSLLAALLACACDKPAPQRPAPPATPRVAVTLEAARLGPAIDRLVYGQFIEHQGRCIYGGIWAELLQDRKFLCPVGGACQTAKGKYASPWRALPGPGAVTMSRDAPYVGEQAPQVRLSPGAAGGLVQGGLGLLQGQTYEGRLQLAGDPGVKVSATLAWGPGPADQQTVQLGPLSPAYAERPLRFTARAGTTDGQLRIEGSGQGTFRVGAASLMPADNVFGMRADVLRLLRQLGGTIYRWPGGGFAEDYNWRDMVGPRDRRPPRVNDSYWSVLAESNDFGLDEFMVFCREVGAAPYMVVSTTRGSPAEAAAEVEYLNGLPQTPMGMLREGRREPYGVRWWGVGSETPNLMAPHDYIHRYRTIAAAMRRVDPAIRLVGVGGYLQDVGWSPGFLQACAQEVDLISEHWYAEVNGRKDNVPDHVQDMVTGIRTIAAMQRYFNWRVKTPQGRQVRLALDEWNYHWRDRPMIFGEAGPRYHLQDALGIAAGLHEIYRNSDVIRMANTHPVNVHGHVKTDPRYAAMEATGLVLQIYSAHYGTVPIAATTSERVLDLAAAWTADRAALTLGVVNPTPQAYALALDLRGARLERGGKLWRVAHRDPMAYNEPGRPPQVAIAEQVLSGEAGLLQVAPFSVTLFHLPARAANVAGPAGAPRAAPAARP